MTNLIHWPSGDIDLGPSDLEGPRLYMLKLILILLAYLDDSQTRRKGRLWPSQSPMTLRGLSRSCETSHPQISAQYVICGTHSDSVTDEMTLMACLEGNHSHE